MIATACPAATVLAPGFVPITSPCATDLLEACVTWPTVQPSSLSKVLANDDVRPLSRGITHFGVSSIGPTVRLADAELLAVFGSTEVAAVTDTVLV